MTGSSSPTAIIGTRTRRATPAPSPARSSTPTTSSRRSSSGASGCWWSAPATRPSTFSTMRPMTGRAPSIRCGEAITSSPSSCLASRPTPLSTSLAAGRCRGPSCASSIGGACASPSVRIGATICRLPDHGLFEAHPTACTLYLDHIVHGRIVAKPGIERLDGKTVHFVDGSREEIDLIVYATGFRPSFPFMDPSFILDEDGPLQALHPRLRSRARRFVRRRAVRAGGRRSVAARGLPGES